MLQLHIFIPNESDSQTQVESITVEGGSCETAAISLHYAIIIASRFL